MTTTATPDDRQLRDKLMAVFDTNLFRTPRTHRHEVAEYVQRRSAQMDRPLTVARLNSLFGAAWHRAGVVPEMRISPAARRLLKL